MSKIIGVTVGTPLNLNTIREKMKIAEADNGKIMQVKDGVWTAVSIEESSVKTFVDEYINSALEGDY